MAECVYCGASLLNDVTLAALLSLRPVRLSQLCLRCLQSFTRIDQKTACPGCGRASSPHLCADCQRWQKKEGLLHNQALFTYDASMQAFMQQYKGLGDYRLHSAFLQVIPTFPRKTALVWLPSEPSHYAKRGFDPVLGLFGHLPLLPWLQKADTDLPQAQKNRRQRLQTPQSFTAHPTNWQAFNRVVLIDDLYTTGRTLQHARAALIAADMPLPISSFSLIR